MRLLEDDHRRHLEPHQLVVLLAVEADDHRWDGIAVVAYGSFCPPSIDCAPPLNEWRMKHSNGVSRIT